MREIIAGMDIGSDSIKMIVAEMVHQRTNILAVSETSSKGIKKGLVTNKEDLIVVLKESLKKCEDVLGLKITKVAITVPSFEAEFMVSEGATTITNEDHVIRGIDIVRAMQASIYNQVPSGLEIVSIVPTSFWINKDEQVRNPLNMTANKLMVKTVVSMIPKKNVDAIISCFDRLGIAVIDISMTSMGDYYAMKSSKIEDDTGAFINIGDETTTVSIFNKGVLTNTFVLEIGGQNIDNDISFIYKVTKHDARSLKENLGLAHKRMASASVSQMVTNKLGERISINQYELSEIIMSRLEEI